MIYRIKYVFSNSRDKGKELLDWYGEHNVYELTQAGCCECPDIAEEEDMEMPEEPETVYELKFNQRNTAARKRMQEDAGHWQIPVVESEKFAAEKFGITGAEWRVRTEEEAPEEEGRSSALVGTELVNFLNFDIDRFLHGGYDISWNYDAALEKEVITGWLKTEGHDLNDLSVRQFLSSVMVYGSHPGDAADIPFFIRMSGSRFINTESWEYDQQEIEHIKELQERFRKFCENVFIPAENDKRTHLERYCENIETIEKKEFGKRIPEGWFTPSSLEDALAVECYAMIKGNVNFFRCANCGRYTVAKDSRSRLCSRYVYDGRVFDGKRFHEYHYICKEEQYLKTARCKNTGDIICVITGYERKRLYHHISRHAELQQVRDRIVMEFNRQVHEHEILYRSKVQKAEEMGQILSVVNDYMTVLVEHINRFITSCMQGKMEKKYLFDRKKHFFIKQWEEELDE
ncbi:MAG: hypothetical protein J6A77_07505 [Lachnospiraceae bacterium]|nr:hypothetical protein [Lachnospiraceae bacterium]